MEEEEARTGEWASGILRGDGAPGGGWERAGESG